MVRIPAFGTNMEKTTSLVIITVGGQVFIVDQLGWVPTNHLSFLASSSSLVGYTVRSARDERLRFLPPWLNRTQEPLKGVAKPLLDFRSSFTH